MKVRDFIIERLTTVCRKFFNIKFTYLYEHDINFHTIIVEPDSIFREDRDYIDFENSFVKEFCRNFPNEDVLFSDKLNHLDDGECIKAFQSPYHLRNVIFASSQGEEIKHNFKTKCNEVIDSEFSLAA